MAWQLRYKGEFLSIQGVLYRAEILQQSDTAFDVGELTFEGSEPLVIEWDDKQKHETIQSSSATLKIESPGDRTYVDLYSVDVANVRLDVYKEDVLYWRGCLDAEFYEEPYERLDMYAVSLTFSDFGIFDRLLFDKGDDAISLHSIILDALDRAGLEYGENDLEHYTSTYAPENETGYPIDLREIYILGSNFYDEEGEQSTMDEVIDGMLQPLALKMIQRNGKVYVYDLNWAWYNAVQEQISWSADSQTLSVDSVYNNAKITFSPYAQNIALADDEFVGEIDEDLINLEKVLPVQYADDVYYLSFDLFRGYLVYEERSEYDSNYGQGFVLWLSTTNHSSSSSIMPAYHELNSRTMDIIPSDESFNAGVYFFRLVPFYLGDEIEGVAIRFARALEWDGDRQWVQMGIEDINFDAIVEGGISYIGHTHLYKSDELRIPIAADINLLNLLVKVEVMLSAGYTPYHTENGELGSGDKWHWSGIDESKNDDHLKKILQYMIVPVRVIFRTDGGDYYAWSNTTFDEYGDVSGFNEGSSKAYNNERKIPMFWVDSFGTWTKISEEEASSTSIIGAFAFYPSSDLKTNAPSIIGSFGSNYQYQGLPYETPAMGKETEAVGGGQMIHIPVAEAGYVHVEILTNWRFYRFYNSYYTRSYSSEMAQHIRWCLIKAPSIELVSYRPWNTEISNDDIEYSAVLNPSAKEDIELDTICGTGGTSRPTARGAYLDASGQKVLTKFSREDLEGTAEELLIATLYSQYAERHTTLSGEAFVSNSEGVTIYTDAAQDSDTKFLMTSRIEDLREGCGDVKLVELSRDEYEPISD